MSASGADVFLCNGASPPTRASRYRNASKLDYRTTSPGKNVELWLPKFVDQLLHVPPRVLDLLEMAAYIFNGDRLTKRGTIDSLEYHSWSRDLEFVIKVRDEAFW